MNILIRILQFILNFAPTLLISETVCCLHQKRRKFFWAVFPLLFAVFVTLFNSSLQFTRGFYDVFDTVGLSYVIIYLISVPVLFAGFRLHFTQALYLGAIGYTVEHLIHNIKFLTRSLFSLKGDSILYLLIAVVIEAAVNLLIYFFFVRTVIRRRSSYRARFNILISAVTVALVAVFAYWVSELGDGTVVTYIYGIITCLALLGMQVLLMRFVEKENESAVVKQLLHLSESQYRMTKENIDIINRKCHDLKHQISALEEIDNVTERKKAVSELKKAVRIYDSIVKTGNDTLNIILTDKNLMCQNNNITFTYVTDASRLGFIEDMDLYVLFGNAIDNAIEAVKDLEEGLRVITLRIVGNDKYLKISMENFMAGTLTLANGLPLTTKADKDYHGFGMQSIKFVVEKYHGHLVFRQIDNMFIMDIVFPLPKAEKETQNEKNDR